MYRKREIDQLEFEEFYLPFGGKLNSKNRWVVLSKLIPWETLEKQYADLFADTGASAKPFRMALGSLIIKERLQVTDRELVEQIIENPYLQYFIGLSEYSPIAPFDASTLVYFRKRLSQEFIQEINENIIGDKIAVEETKESDEDRNDPSCKNSSHNDKRSGQDGEKPNAGTMMVDASVAPADITYPTDLKLLGSVRVHCELVVDILHEPLRGKQVKPRTYRNKARKEYLLASKKRKLSKKGVRKAIRQQLQYIRRDFDHIDALLENSSFTLLSPYEYKKLLVAREVYRQQQQMYESRSHSISDRIVSLAQPHVRPIVRGKASASVEFGAKIMVSRNNGFHILEDLSWDNVNESSFLQKQIERYKERTGVYPEVVLADQLYRTRDNLTYCKEHGIRLSGPKLGRPSKTEIDQKKIERSDSAMRNAIEGTFGTAKRRYGMSRIMTKLRETSENSIALILLVMNLEKL